MRKIDVHVRIPPETVELLDYCAALGIFKSRSEAIQSILQHVLGNEQGRALSVLKEISTLLASDWNTLVENHLQGGNDLAQHLQKLECAKRNLPVFLQECLTPTPAWQMAQHIVEQKGEKSA